MFGRGLFGGRMDACGRSQAFASATSIHVTVLREFTQHYGSSHSSSARQRAAEGELVGELQVAAHG